MNLMKLLTFKSSMGIKKIFLVFDKEYFYEQKKEEKYGGLKFKNLFGEFKNKKDKDGNDVLNKDGTFVRDNILKVLFMEYCRFYVSDIK